MAHHLNFEANKLNFLRVSKVAVGLVNYAITDGAFYSFVRFLLFHLRLGDYLLDELALEDEQLTQGSILKKNLLNHGHKAVFFLIIPRMTLAVVKFDLNRRLEDWNLHLHGCVTARLIAHPTLVNLARTIRGNARLVLVVLGAGASPTHASALFRGKNTIATLVALLVLSCCNLVGRRFLLVLTLVAAGIATIGTTGTQALHAMVGLR